MIEVGHGTTITKIVWKVGDRCRIKSKSVRGEVVVSNTIWTIAEISSFDVVVIVPDKWRFRCTVGRLVRVSAVEALGSVVQ